MCSKSFTFFPSIPFSNLDPIPLHCSCHCNFFILLLLLFSYVFSFFTANALKQCAFSFVSFKFSYLIFSQWCQMVRWNYETLKSVEFISNLSLVSISFPPTTWPMLLTFCFPLYFLFLSLPRYQAHGFSKKRKRKKKVSGTCTDVYYYYYYYYYCYCGAEGFGNLGPFHIKPKAHAEEKEMSEEEQRKSRLSGYTIEDDPVFGELRSRKGKVPRHQWRSLRASQRKAQTQWASHRSMVEKQFQERLSPSH